MTSPPLLEVPARFRRSRNRESASTDVAVALIEHMCADLGLEDLGATEVLDYGCGIKFTEALVNRSLPVKRYVGADVYGEMIDFLRSSVADPRFEYVHVDAHNAMYNPDGARLTPETRLPVGGADFDLICLFSVFTHLAPQDYRALLQILRRHARPDGRLFFTLYIDEVTEGGHGLMDSFARKLGPSAVGAIETFRDLDPTKPLAWAVYSERHARELIDGTGWEVVSLLPPVAHLQHHFVCEPA